MFFILSKLLHFLVSPLSWIIILLISGIFIKKRRPRFFAYAILLLFVFTNPFLINIVMHAWEVPSRNSKTISVPYEGGIVLGGAMRYFNTTMERPVYGSSVDRLMQTIALYQEGKIRKIILAGGSGFVTMQDPKESEILYRFLVKMNIPAEDILIEKESRNTHENAVNTITLLRSKHVTGKFLLITSGYHMRRSLGCFEKAEFPVDPYSVDEHSGVSTYTPDKLFLPEAENLQTWDLLVHEWIGYVTYKIVGYI